MTTSADAQPGEQSKCEHKRAVSVNTDACQDCGKTGFQIAAAPVWRPRTERPAECANGCPQFQVCDYCQFGGRGQFDPAPGHEEQVNVAQENALSARMMPGLSKPTLDSPAAAPTIEQDRQAWRSWFGAYSEPVKPFGSRHL